MLNRLMACVTIWGLGGALAWFVAHEYVTAVTDKLNLVTRALARL